MDLAGIRRSPFPLGGILAGSWRVFAGRFWTILGMTLLVYVPYEILVTLLSPRGDSWHDVARARQIGSVLSTLIGILATLATYLVIEGELIGSRVTLGQAMKHALWRWRSGVATELVWGLVVIAGLVLLVVPGVVLAGFFVFTLCAVSLRDCSLREAMRYSKSLVKGRWWSVVGVLAIIVLIVSVVVVVASLAVDMLGEHFAVEIVSGLMADLATSFLTVATGVYFVALDRKEPELEAAESPASPAGAEEGLVPLTPTPPG